MKNITEEELARLEDCQSAQDWSDACDAVKEARDGHYPDDWWNKVKLSGMMDRILGRWGADSNIRSVSFNKKSDALKHMGYDES